MSPAKKHNHAETVLLSSKNESELKASIQSFHDLFYALQNEVQKLIVGQEEIVRNTLISMIAGGHVLLEGLPGLGKTALVKSISDALHLSFQRIQFTPDLMPTDLIGTKMFIEDTKGGSRFEFSPGPIFCNLLLGDEINRATPKTQSALLEAMQEKHVTIAGETRPLDKPFFVLATQNPLELEGTYPLPEAQLDRFFFKLNVPFPSAEEFEEIIERTTGKITPEVNTVFEGGQLLEMGRFARETPVTPSLKKQAVQLILATHPDQPGALPEVKRYIRYGASPRAGQTLLLAAKIRAILEGRFHVAEEDILFFAKPVLRHRVMTNFEAQADGILLDDLIEQVCQSMKSQWARNVAA